MRTMGSLSFLCLLGVGAGCAGSPGSSEDTVGEVGDTGTADPDPDGDGFTADNGDCQPNDPSIHPEGSRELPSTNNTPGQPSV